MTIADLNDAFRMTFQGGRVVTTAGVAAMSDPDKAAMLGKVRAFSEFTADNDPNGEHDFGRITYDGCQFFWKIDYYDEKLEGGSEDPTDTAKTTRVLTIMYAEEY